jgi:hypothetical protein
MKTWLTLGRCWKIVNCFYVQREVSETILQPRKGIRRTSDESIIYIFGQHMELPRASKIPTNSHINRRKKKEKLPTTGIMKKLD